MWSRLVIRSWWTTGDGLLDSAASTIVDRLTVAERRWQHTTGLALYSYGAISGVELSAVADCFMAARSGYRRVEGSVCGVIPQGDRCRVSINWISHDEPGAHFGTRPRPLSVAVPGLWCAGQDVADVGVLAVGGLEQAATGDEPLEIGLELGEFDLSRTDIGKLVGEQIGHVRTRRMSAIPHVDDVADFCEGEPRRLRIANEECARDARLVVGAVAVGGPPRCGQEPLAFVKPDRLAIHADGVGEFTYEHPSTLPLDLIHDYRVYVRNMDITLQYFDGCPHWKIADERLAVLATERPDLRITHQQVETVEDAESVAFHGSPTVLVDGIDPFEHSEGSVGLACRIYQTPEGSAGFPSLEQLRQAVGNG